MKTAINALLRTSVATTLVFVGADGRAASGDQSSDKCIVSLEARPEFRPRAPADARPCPVALISSGRPRLDV
jgi:hypothetical protein